MQFLNAESGQQALKVSADFVDAQVEAGQNLTLEQVNHILDTLASADMLIDNLKNKQPVLHSMFKVALDSSEKLKTVA